MSSEGSISSRISQFGLYRTIDARTEEFLKLSKKRQIRQGCVCAAISTAVTVTVVVAMLLVYEYNIINDAKRTNGKLNWLDLMNGSVNDPILQERFNKANIKIDKTTLKLLPILLNALGQNKYTGKKVDVPSSIYPPYQIRDTTDNAYTKNIFADTRNWMKMPHSRLYTIEYKSSPMVYFKNPTRNVDYFTKIRKIRDHQRILKYVNKMIKENKKEGSTEPMKSYTEVPLKTNVPIRKNTPRNKTTSATSSAKLSTEKKSNCKCPHRLMELMKKLLTSIQTLLSYLSGFSSTETLPHLKTFIEINDMNSSTSRLESTTIQNLNENEEEPESEIIKPTPYKTFLNRHKYTVDFSNIYDLRRDQNSKTMMNLIKPSYRRYNQHTSEFQPTESFSSHSYNIYSKTLSPTKEATDAASSVSFLQYIAHTTTEKSPDIVTTIADYILQKGTYDMPSSGTTSVISKYSENDFDEDDDYTETTATLVKNFNDLDTNKSEINKSKKTHSEESIPEIKEMARYNFKGASTNQRLYTDIGLIRKFGNLAARPKDIKTFSPIPYRFAPISRLTSKTTTIRTTPSTNNPKYLNSISKPTAKQILNKTNKTNSQSNNITEFKVRIPKQDRVNEITLDGETKKILKIDKSKEAIVNYIEDAIQILANNTTNYAETIATISDTNQWKLVESEERKSSIRSMIPQNKPTYLEMQRNDWRQDDNLDYDNETFD